MPEPQKQKYQILIGIHIEGKGPTRVIYRAGENDIIETSTNLLKQNGGNGALLKFRLVANETPVPVSEVKTEIPSVTPVIQNKSDDGLEDLTKADLRKLASDNEIDLLGVPNDKESLLSAIRNSGKL